MKFEEFVTKIQEEVQNNIRETGKVEVHQITKNNGHILIGIAIRKEERKISPMIYLEEYYEDYEAGMCIEDIAEEIMELYEQSVIEFPIDSDFYRDFDNLKENILCKVINYEKNKSLLEEIPHMKCMDLAIVFYYLMDYGEAGSGTILIYNSHMEMWQVTLNQIYEIARRNTYQQMPFVFRNVKDILKDSLRELGEELEKELEENVNFPMYVLTNVERYLGAVQMMYDCVLSKIAQELHGDFYVLPSSIHECILIPADPQIKGNDLESMVREVNASQVLPEEVLSDHIYYYEHEDHRLSMVLN